MSTTATMPRWDLTPFFPSLASDEYRSGVAELDARLDHVENLFREFGITPLENPRQDADSLAEAIEAINALQRQGRLVFSYTSLKVSTDSLDEEAQAAQSALNPRQVRSQKLFAAFTAWVGTLDLEALVPQNQTLQNHAFPLQRAKQEASRLMSAAEEALAADLDQTADSAWAKLYNDFSSNIVVSVQGEELPMSACRALAYDPVAQTRRQAYEAELAAWKQNEIPLAAAMNSIKGTNNLLAERRGWQEQLNVTLHVCNMDRQSLDAMMEAAEESFPDWRRYLRAKAKALGHNGNGLPFYDIFAPLGEDRAWTWEEGTAFVEDGFRAYSDRLADFAVRTFREDWHDVPPQKGKRDGAFCAGLRDDESRMLHNFKPSFGSVSTLAHELGHAYHNLCLAERTPLQRQTPMTLAETASIFCETIIKRRALAESKGDAKLAILEATLMGANQTVVDITSRYRFESETIARRRERELSPSELCDIMRQAQLSTYGNGLDPDLLHPYMWAAKPHYYGGLAFYNFPYMFGLLFALGLYRIYQEEPKGFHDRYDELLSSTGLAPAAELTAQFGIDIRDKAFWAGSLAVLKEDIDEYVSLIG